MAERTCKTNIVAMHTPMSASGAADQVAEGLHKLAANADELCDYAKNR